MEEKVSDIVEECLQDAGPGVFSSKGTQPWQEGWRVVTGQYIMRNISAVVV